jgi:hypothetical protein
VRALAPKRERPGATEEQEKVLAEISHELGNFFHKLYYWADFLKDKPSRRAADTTAAQMLHGTVRSLEGFLKIGLAYFQPVQLSTTRMGVNDLVAGLLCQVRSLSDRAPLTAEQDGVAWDGAWVMVDPGRLSQAFEIVVRHLGKQLGPTSHMAVTVERRMQRGGPCVEISFCLSQPGEESPLLRTAEAGIEWAMAERVWALHGGQLAEQALSAAEKRITLTFPLQG